jgi:hydroxyacylglutathione hydrolase
VTGVTAGILRHLSIDGKEKIVRTDVLTVGMFQSNCFVVSCGKTRQAVVIDAGDEADRIAAHVRDEGLAVQMIVCTHGHIDHVAALPELASVLGAPVAMHEDELVLYENVDRQAALFGLPTPGKVKVQRPLSDGDVTPPVAFVGDVLFRGSIGRTDLMGASERQMIKTLKDVILRFPDDTIIYPGHGPETTIRVEKRSNPFLIDLEGWSY